MGTWVTSSLGVSGRQLLGIFSYILSWLSTTIFSWGYPYYGVARVQGQGKGICMMKRSLRLVRLTQLLTRVRQSSLSPESGKCWGTVMPLEAVFVSSFHIDLAWLNTQCYCLQWCLLSPTWHCSWENPIRQSHPLEQHCNKYAEMSLFFINQKVLYSLRICGVS